MPKLARAYQAIVVAAGLAAVGNTLAEEPAVASDRYAWLEDVEGDKSLDWVKARNAKAEAELAGSAGFNQLEAELREILDSDAKIPEVYKVGAHYYNFWKDKQHERGLWRRTTLEEYRKPQPQWETVLDLDALNKAEGENWVWHGATCLKPEYRRCLVALSRGGADADVTREFDLVDKAWVKDGFFRPEAKGSLSWIDRDTVYVETDFGPGSMTSSGYARIVKEWKRGEPMSSAKLVYEVKPEDIGVGASHDFTPGYPRDFVSRTIDFYSNELYLRGRHGVLVKVDAPDSASKNVHKEWLLLQLRDPYRAGGKDYKAGSLIATKFDDFMEGKRDFTVLFEPTDNTSLAGYPKSPYAWTKNHLVLDVMEDVKDRLVVLTPGDGEWTRRNFVGAPAIGNVKVEAVDTDNSDAVWMTTTDFLAPSTLSIVDISGKSGGNAPEPLKSEPAFFDASGFVAEQHFATSKDGTRIPYFLVRSKHLAFDGKAPTLLWGYGGFEVSYPATYNPLVGRGWLEQGGVFALANIRGGGEYGPLWHQAALKQNRHKAYEDFAAVADDLVARKITSPQHLGAMGGSNGGLLTGNMLTQYPEKFGAIVIQVPLLDMKRYSHLLAGASWMGEYGNPDTADWEFIQTFSPYHLFDASKAYPPVLFTTSTRDDRVHPAHARKMMAKMEAAGKDVRYYENIEGGHGGAANNAQSAHMRAQAYTFLWQQLNP